MKLSAIIITSIIITSSMLGAAAQATKCFPCIPFEQEFARILATKHFKVCMDERDMRVPRLFVTTKRHVPSLCQWTPDEWIEFSKLEKILENGLRSAFQDANVQLINVACLMNLAGPEGTHTHWHFIPRFSLPYVIRHPETNDSHLFEDPCYGKPYDFNSKNYRSAKNCMKLAIINHIIKHLDVSNLDEAQIRG